ncbi:hypothetical protein ISTM_38 [Insectomime virus]|uniref:DUF5858 domain-containing protein n=1 Tax=Tunisvirus fontaine2 TaxID=1421067 RepID=V9SE41_9VIRU|nr:hypothetical protein D1R32_gp288 [Tunisvirus fontaine2]AHA45936.1 hypothetical protein ISTM_38 [Insectomime virus]AHC55005.1 hypothetical protein TNS_ORF287 [Tunisvirus fontaine2]
MEALQSEVNKFILEVQKEIGTGWFFYTSLLPGTKPSLMFTSGMQDGFVDVKLMEQNGQIIWMWKEKKDVNYVSLERDVGLRRIAKDIMNSQSYRLMMIQNQLEKMNSKFDRMIELLSNGIEYSPNNTEKVDELGQHFSSLATSKH